MSLGTVLVVEDDDAIRRGLVDALRFSGYTLHEASDGRAGLDLALSIEADIVLLDIMMPRMSGLEVLEELRGDRSLLPNAVHELLRYDSGFVVMPRYVVEAFELHGSPLEEGQLVAEVPDSPAPVWWYFCVPPNEQLLAYWDTAVKRRSQGSRLWTQLESARTALETS